MAFRRTFREEFSLFFEIPAMISLAVLGLLLLPVLAPFLIWKRKANNHKEG